MKFFNLFLAEAAHFFISVFGILLGDEEKIEFYETFEIDNTGKNKLKKQQTIFVSFFWRKLLLLSNLVL